MSGNSTTEQDRRAAECPVCGNQPNLLHYERDRGLHPALDNLRYSCAKRGHIIAAQWAEANLGEDRNSDRLKNEAANAWNAMIHRLTAQAGLVEALEAAYEVLLKRDLELEGWGETPLLIQIRTALTQAKDG